MFYLVVILVGILMAAMISFVAMGMLQHRRTLLLARKAHERGLQFSSDDLFDIPRRYGDFAVICGGHSSLANNLTYGRLEGWPVRAFDFRYEAGHGPLRVTRHYGIVVLETPVPLPPALMWHDLDASAAPALCRLNDRRNEGWSYSGQDELVAVLARCCSHLASWGVSVQTRGPAVLLCVPIWRRRETYMILLDRLEGLVEGLREYLNSTPLGPQVQETSHGGQETLKTAGGSVTT